jgi:tellurite resistance-related uncharacterized protein
MNRPAIYPTIAGNEEVTAWVSRGRVVKSTIVGVATHSSECVMDPHMMHQIKILSDQLRHVITALAVNTHIM